MKNEIRKFSRKMNLNKENRKRSLFHMQNRGKILFSIIFFVLFIQLTVIGSNFRLQHSNQVNLNQKKQQNSEILQFNGQIDKKLAVNQLQFGLGTYFGGASDDILTGIVIDSFGNIYVTGFTTSQNLPTRNAYNATYGGNTDAFVAKFNESGFPIFSTYLGGSQDDEASGIAVDNAQNIYVTGHTFSNNFPVKNAYQPSLTGTENAFITKFNSQGLIVFSSYLGGSGVNNYANGIAVDKFGNSYIIGYTDSTNFPVKNAYNAINNGSKDGFLTKYDTVGNLIFSTYIGGLADDILTSVAVDNNQIIYATGYSDSSNFPQLHSLQYQTGSENAVYVKFNSTGSLIFSTYYGGTLIDDAYKIAIDNLGDAVITGTTESADFPVKNAFQNNYNGSYDVFVTKFSSNNSIVFSTFLGGNNSDFGYGAAFDSNGNIYIAGRTYSNNFYVSTDAFQKTSPHLLEYAFLTKLSPSGSILYSTYFGGSQAENDYGLAVDANNNVFMGITTYSADMPEVNAYYPTYFGFKDVFIAGFYSSLGPIVSNLSSSSNNTGNLNSQNFSSSNPATITNNSTSTSFQDLFNNPVFLGLGAIAIFSIVLNVLFLIRKRK